MKDNLIKVTPIQKKSLAIATAVVVLYGIYFLWGYFLLIALASIVALAFNPIYQKLLAKWGKPSRAATLTLLLSFLTLIIPVLVVLGLTIHEITVFVDKFSQVDLNAVELDAIKQANSTLEKAGIDYVVTVDSVKSAVSSGVEKFGKVALGGVLGFLGNFFSLFSTAIIYIFVFMSILLNQDKIVELVKRLNPLGREVSELYLDRVSTMTKAMVKGQFVIAFLQGTTDAALLYFAGLHDLFFFFAVLLTALSVIPLGGGIVAIPIGIFMLLTGQIWQGLLVLGGHFLIVTNIDNVMRPRLVPQKARLDSALTLLAVFSGISMFGFLGIIIGPVIMIIIVTTVQVFVEVFHNVESINRDVETKKHKKKLTDRAKFWDKSVKTS